MLSDLEVFVIDCQASGANPKHGALLEIGWTVTSASQTPALTPPDPDTIHTRWITPPPGLRVPRPVRALTGWSEACLTDAEPEETAWARLTAEVARRARPPAPCVIHFARFELGFLEDLHRRRGEGPFPLDTVCLHEVARRLYPELPRRNIRALAGFLGFSPCLERRAAGHVEASAFIWRALVPALAARSLHTWEDLKAWLAGKAPPRTKRTYPLASERRRALPGQPGVYRFLRSNGDVLYVGKAANLRKRVASHFTRGGRANERALEMLTQVHDLDVTPAATVLEAALLETDEIKRLSPPYNVQLQQGRRRAWFASPDLTAAHPTPDDQHRIGPLPSAGALTSLAAIRRLAHGADADDLRLRAAAVEVAPPWAPDPAVFRAAWATFSATYLSAHARNPWFALLRAAKALARTGVDDTSDDDQDAAPDAWDLDRVRRHLDRALLRGGQLLRRARCLVLLSEANITFREREDQRFRLLVVDGAEIVDRQHLDDPLATPKRGPRRTWADRQSAMDAARYDRMRVLATELSRVRAEGGAAFLRIGDRLLDDRALARLLA